MESTSSGVPETVIVVAERRTVTSSCENFPPVSFTFTGMVFCLESATVTYASVSEQVIYLFSILLPFSSRRTIRPLPLTLCVSS